MKKKPIYFNLETFDYTPYARELTEEEMYLVNGGRVVKGSARETEVVPSRPSSSSESGNSSGSSSTSNSVPVPAATQTTTGSSQTNSSSQPNNTESQTSSAPTCTAAQMAAAQGAAMNAYFAEQDKKREENNKQQNSSSSSSSSSSSDNNSTTQSSNSDSENLTDKAYPSSRDENYGKYSSETSNESNNSNGSSFPSANSYYGINNSSEETNNSINNSTEDVIDSSGEYSGGWHMNEDGGFKASYEGTPVNNGEQYAHNGEDYRWIDSDGVNRTLGQIVYSTTEGVVIACDEDLSNPRGADPNNKGNWVRVQMPDGWIRDYYHLNSISVSNGDILRQGTQIGNAGNTGASTGPHLHIDEFNYLKPLDYDSNPDMYLKKSYDGGNSFIYFRNPLDYQ